MPAPLMTKDEVLARLTSEFRKSGYEGSTLSKLSKATGLVKASLYHYFPKGKQDMALAVLEGLTAQFKQTVLDPLAKPGDPRERLRDMCVHLADFYVNGDAACLVDLFSMGEAKQLFNDEIQGTVKFIRSSLQQVLEETGMDPVLAEQRATKGLVLIQGALVTSRALNDRFVFMSTMNDLPNELLRA